MSYYGDADSAAIELFAYAVEQIAEGTKLGIELASEKLAHEINKEKTREKLNILEYAENAKNKKNFYTPNEAEEDRLVSLIKVNDPDFDKELFEHFAEDVFKKFQQAYCNRNLDSLRKYVDINVLEQFKMKSMQNDASTGKEEIIIKSIDYVDIFGYHQDGNSEVVSVALGIDYYDFIRNNEGEVIFGSEKIKMHAVYIISFARKKGGKTIKNIKDYINKEIHCPNCGGKITNSYSECEYCHAILFNSTENWLLTHIEEM